MSGEIKLYNCDCLFNEAPNSVEDSAVKSYVLVSECSICQAKREADAIESAKQRRRQEIITELNELDKKAMRPLLDGETDRVDTIKAQKVTLRTELGTL